MSYVDPGEFTATRNRKRASVATDTNALDLFGTPPAVKPARGAPYQADSDTSREAAERIQPHTTAMRETVYTAIASCGSDGATRKELEAITGYLTQTLCARLNELEHAGRIRKLMVLDDASREAVTVRREGCCAYTVTGPIR